MTAFSLTDEEQEKFKEWDLTHNCELKNHAGAIGGRLTFCFTPTGLGMCIVIKCACGQTVDLTDTENW